MGWGGGGGSLWKNLVVVTHLSGLVSQGMTDCDTELDAQFHLETKAVPRNLMILLGLTGYLNYLMKVCFLEYLPPQLDLDDFIRS